MIYWYYLLHNSIIPLYQINTSFLEKRSPTRLKSTSLLGDYLQINGFPDPVLVEQEL